MPRQKTGRPVGRQPKYQSEEEKPVTVSLRIPREWHDRLRRYASIHRQSISELLLDGLKTRLGQSADPRELSVSEEVYYDNTDVPVSALEEIRTALARQEKQLQALAQALEHRSVGLAPSMYYGNAEEASAGQSKATVSVPEVNGGLLSCEEHTGSGNTVLHREGHAVASSVSPQLRQLNAARQRIVEYILSRGNQPVTDVQVHEALGLTEKPRLRDMVKAGILEKVAKGEYVVAAAYTVGAAQARA
jgi:hypothetical protein